MLEAMSTKTIVAGTAIAFLLLSAGLQAQETPLPITFAAGADGSDATSGATTGADAGSSATPAGASGRFLGFKDKESFHRFSGWASGGILLAAGVVGGVHALQMMNKAHEWRDAHGIDEEDTSACVDEIQAVWNDSGAQALRWTHVGLLATGETLYLANAVTGAQFMGPLPPGWSKAKVHRYAFFVHAALMATEGVLGFLTTDALKDGDHERMTGLLAAHTGIGIAIPVVILGAGAIMTRRADSP
jgi:hypothetical protein